MISFLRNIYKKLNCELITSLCEGYFQVKYPDCFDGCKAYTAKIATKKDNGSECEVIFA